MNLVEKFLAEQSNGLAVQSGVYSALNPKVRTSLNEFGEYRAHIDPSEFTLDELSALARVSAMANDELNETVVAERLFANIPGIRHHAVIGYHSGIFAGHVTEGAFRAEASSGGFGTWLLVELLERGLIDGVIHAHAAPQGAPVLFNYTVVSTPAEIALGAKSRYYPLDLSAALIEARARGGRYAITGIPSFITELRLLAIENPDFNETIAFTIGLVCGHQKSTKYAEALAWEQGFPPGTLRSIDFRKKVLDARSDEYATELSGLRDGELKTLTTRAKDSFVGSWSMGFFKSKLSDFTDDVFNETADVTLGDAWLPEYEKDPHGTNLLIVRHPAIAAILDDGLARGAIHLEAIQPETAIRTQGGLMRHAREELPYRLHATDRRGAWRPVKRLVASSRLSFARARIQDTRMKISESSHLAYAEAVRRRDWGYFVRAMRPLVRRHDMFQRLDRAAKAARKGPVFVVRRGWSSIKSRVIR